MGAVEFLTGALSEPGTRRLEVDTFERMVTLIRALDELRIPFEVRSHDVAAPFGGPGDVDRSYIVDARS